MMQNDAVVEEEQQVEERQTKKTEMEVEAEVDFEVKSQDVEEYQEMLEGRGEDGEEVGDISKVFSQDGLNLLP